MTAQLEQVDLSLFKEMWQTIVAFLPNLVAAIIVIILGWLFIKLITFFLKRGLKAAKVDNLAEKLNEIEIFRKIKFKPSKIITSTVKWILNLIVLIVIADILNMQMLKDAIVGFIAYLPQLFSALAILFVGIIIANMVKNAVSSVFKSLNLGGAKAIGNILFMVIAVIVSITALNQAGINTDIITNNLTIIFGALLLAFTIAFGLGSKNIIERLLFGFYSRKNLAVGQYIKINNVEGRIESLDNISVLLNTKEGKIMLPIKEVNDNVVVITDQKV